MKFYDSQESSVCANVAPFPAATVLNRQIDILYPSHYPASDSYPEEPVYIAWTCTTRNRGAPNHFVSLPEDLKQVCV